MTDYRAVMTLLIQQRSYRQIEDQLGSSHRAISRANHALRSLGLTTIQQVTALTNDELDEIFVDNRSSGQGQFVPINFDAVVKARAGRTKQTLQLLWARYTSIPAQAGQRHYSYDRFRQLVTAHVDAAGLTARITHAPGHTMQVDWAGTKMRLYDPAGKLGAKVSIFVASLPYSGLLFACACVDQRQQSWLDAHRQAFDYFGGLPGCCPPIGIFASPSGFPFGCCAIFLHLPCTNRASFSVSSHRKNQPAHHIPYARNDSQAHQQPNAA